LAFTVLLLAGGILAPSFSMRFFVWQFERNGTYAVLDMSETDLHYVARGTIDYLSLRRDSLADIRVTVGGAERYFYNYAEVCHMRDVWYLFRNGIYFTYIAGGMFVLTAVILLFTERNKFQRLFSSVMSMWRGFAVATLIVMAVLGSLIFINFDRAFIVFHEMFFIDNWMFSPADSLMINMLPTEFFMDISTVMLSAILISMAFVITAATILRKIISAKEVKNAG